MKLQIWENVSQIETKGLIEKLQVTAILAPDRIHPVVLKEYVSAL